MTEEGWLYILAWCLGFVFCWVLQYWRRLR